MGRIRRAFLLGFALAYAQTYPGNIPPDHEAIRYHATPPHDAVSRLTATPAGLASLLKALDINRDTQALVFSKTSFQASKIGPRTPRAIYFNDEVAVGFVRGSDSMEVAALDPNLGYIFYTFETADDNPPKFTRREQCLHCHQGPATQGVPGTFIGSVFPDSAGNAHAQNAIITDHRTPFAERWGGWFVDAARGHPRDRSNAAATDPAEPETLRPIPKDAAGTSDIVALMVFEHQTQMTNRLTRLNWLARVHDPSIEAAIQETADYMMFRGEAPITEPIEGVSTFTKTFAERGPLREFDLKTRLFKHRLSYLIYSASFDALPEAIRARIYRRLREGLDAETVEILRKTKRDLPPGW